jgi:ketosteroid isomerase-like protein
MTNQEAAAAAYELFRSPGAAVDGVVAVLHDDVVFECPFYDGFEPRVGKAVVATMMRSMDQGEHSYFSRQAFPFHQLLATPDPDRFVIEVQGDHVIRATGRPYRNHYFHCLTIEDGRIVRWVEYSNPNEHARAAGH